MLWSRTSLSKDQHDEAMRFTLDMLAILRAPRIEGHGLHGDRAKAAHLLEISGRVLQYRLKYKLLRYKLRRD